MEENNIYIFVVIGLVFLSALFSCSETSITAASRAKIHRLATEGNKRAKKLEKLLKNREKVVGAILAGNNALNILASTLATGVLIRIFGENGLIYATVGMTISILIFAEILPKTLAFKSPNNAALLLAPLIDVLFKIFLPFTIIAHKVVDFFIDPFFQKSQKHSKFELEEIRDTIHLKTKEGHIPQYDKDLIDGVLDLSDTEISEIMVHRKDMKSINIDLPTEEFILQALEMNHTRIPLWKGDRDNIVAILNIRKLLRFLHLNKGRYDKFDLKELTSEPWFLPSNNTLCLQLFAFRKRKKRFALVVDEYGSLLGMLTLEDILEEIVGEISDQENESKIDIIKIKSGAYKIAGRSLIRDVNKKLEWDINEDDAYNLTAFIINNLGRIPEEKEHFVIDGYYFEILKRKDNDLILIKAKKLNVAKEKE